MLIVSIDSLNPAEHDSIRRKPESYARANASIHRAVQAGMNTYVSFVVTKRNVQEIPGVAEFAQKAGLAGVSFKFFKPAGNGFLNRDRFELGPADRERAHQLLRQVQEHSPIDLRYFQNTEAGCSCGVTQLTLRPNGDVVACPYSAFVVGNALETPLAELWRRFATRGTPAQACFGEVGVRSPMQLQRSVIPTSLT